MNNSMVKIFLGGFPLDKNELELVQLVSPYCEVLTIKIVRDKKTKICKGYAFLEVTSKQGALQVTEALDGTRWGDRLLSVNIVPESPAQQDTIINRPKRPRINIR
jgi:RNA recognition motif-containing protein